MDITTLDKLAAQCKSNDVDARVDAITKLQAEFETGLEITDPDALISALRACVRHQNNHLSSATLAALPPFLPLVATRSLLRSHGTNSPTTSTSSATSSTHVDTVMLRQLLNAFLPAGGGLIDRLGDSREKSRDNARQSLVLLGGYAFRAGATGGSSLNASRSRDGKGPETPLQIFERSLRESGLTSKVWRVREQSMLTLVEIRRAHHLFPIRPYLPLLVAVLEDSDANVRECAKQIVPELFTGPAVSDAARADLKKEMTKKGVRKAIVDVVLTKIAAGPPTAGVPATPGPSSPDVETGDEAAAKKEYIPPSMALMGRRPTAGCATPGSGFRPTRIASSGANTSRPSSRTAIVSPPVPTPPAESSLSGEVKPVYIASDRDLENEFAAMVKPYEGKETEHNWADRERAILQVRGMLKTGVHERFHDTFLSCLQHGFITSSLKALASLRTTVASNTCSLYTELVTILGTAADPFCDTLYTALLAMAGFTKKIVAQQTQAAVTTIMNHTSAQPRLVVHLLQRTLQEKNVQSRMYAAQHIKTYLAVHGTRSKGALEASGNADILEQLVKRALQDPNIGVREAARGAFWAYESVWSDRAKVILASLEGAIRKGVEKACPDPVAAARMALDPSGESQTVPKKSSVAAAIAASRAKAKAIANAPPTLMHRATSTSHAQAAMRSASPPIGRAVSPSLSNGSSDGGMRVPSSLRRSPQTPPKSRILPTVNRSVSSSVASPPPARQNLVHTPPHSPRTPPPATKRRSSSPLTSTTSPERSTGLQKAANTALPSSPPMSIVMTPPTPRTVVSRRDSPRATIASILTYPSQAHTRPSSIMPNMKGRGLDDDSMLLATNIPIPEDSDSEIDMDIDETQENLISFSSPYEKYPPARPSVGSNTLSNTSNSQVLSFSPKSGSSARLPLSDSLSSSSVPRGAQGAVVEDALRARAEQAQSAAERLLELVDPDEEGAQHSSIPPSLLPNGGVSIANGRTMLNGSGMSTPKIKAKISPGVSLGVRGGTTPSTPVSRNSAIVRQAALFRDSPVNKSRSASLMDVLNDRRHESGWWLKRMNVIQQGSPLKAGQPAERVAELVHYITALESGSADVRTLQKLALLCVENPLQDPLSSGSNGQSSGPISPSPMPNNAQSVPSLHKDLWTEGKHFDRLFYGLMKFLSPDRDEFELEYALIVLWELLANQASCLEGHEADMFSSLLRVRACNKTNVLEATNTIRDALTSRTEAVYGLTTIHGSLRAFQAEPPQAGTSADTKASTVAFGLIALGQFILRLPAEILEDELPRLKGTLISALSATASLVVRESAAAAIVAAQLVLQDEAHLFELLDGLPDEKKNLLTYLFDKHGARGGVSGTGARSPGVEKLQKEMRRLDTRTSTPPRPRVLSSALT